MSVQFNPQAPVTRKPQMHSQNPFRKAHHHSHSRASTLTVRAAPISCFDRLKTWVASICTWFQNLFSRKPTPSIVPNNPGTAAPSTANTGAARPSGKGDTTAFVINDLDYSAYRGKDIGDLRHAENCCSFPKLALHLSKKHGVDIHTACKRINVALRKAPASTTLTAKFVLENS